MSLAAGLRNHKVVIGAVALWIPIVSFGFAKLLSYSTTPGRRAEPPLEWPAGSRIAVNSGEFSLLMFVHPRCGCTRASLGELDIIMAHSEGRAKATIIFYEPHEEPVEWTKSDLWRTAAAIHGVDVVEDRNGKIAQSFGVYTSGQTLLYNPAGGLLFKGGITAQRGHSGDNAGRSVVTALLQGAVGPDRLPATTPVFGCSLRGE